MRDINFPQPKKTYVPEVGDTEAFSIINSIFKYTLRRYAKLAKENNFVFLIIDTNNYYHPFVNKVNEEFGISIIHIGAHEWKKDIEDFSQSELNKLYLYTNDGSLAWMTHNISFSYNYNYFIKFNFSIENIFDIHYRTYSSGISAPGRNVNIGLNFKF